MPSAVLIIYKKVFLIKGKAAGSILSFFPQKNNARCLLRLKPHC